MTIVVSPSLQELRAIVGLADGYLQQADDLDKDLHADLGTAVVDCVQWLDALESLTPASEIAMAQAVIAKHNLASNKGPEIAQMLFLNTAHIEQTTSIYLDDGMDFGLTVFRKGDYGWFIYVDSQDLVMSQLPDDLFACVKYAKDLGCVWICLDMDGQSDGNLPSYDW
jgi:hypothetical protein